MGNMFKPVETTLPVETSFWARCKAFWLQDAEAWLSQDADEVLDRAWQRLHDFFYGTKKETTNEVEE